MMAPRRRRRRRWLEMMALSNVLVVAAPSMASTASRASRSGAHTDLVRAARATLLVAPVAVSAPWTVRDGAAHFVEQAAGALKTAPLLHLRRAQHGHDRSQISGGGFHASMVVLSCTSSSSSSSSLLRIRQCGGYCMRSACDVTRPPWPAMLCMPQFCIHIYTCEFNSLMLLIIII